MRHHARLSTAVPHSTAFWATRRVTTPAPVSMVMTCCSSPGNRVRCGVPSCSSFSVLMTADRAVSGTAPPVYPVPPPRGITVSLSSMQARTSPGISASLSGISTTKGYSTRQSVASVTWEARA